MFYGVNFQLRVLFNQKKQKKQVLSNFYSIIYSLEIALLFLYL